MEHEHFVVQSPSAPAKQLLLLFHGVGDNPLAMGEIGSWFAPQFPGALIVSIGGPASGETHQGPEWFSIALNHLRYTVPKHYFDEALSAGKPNDDDIVEFI